MLASGAAAAQERAAPGDTSSALPGIHRVGIAGFGEARVAGALTAGYGMTESQTDTDSTHHRVLAVPAVAVVPTPWLAAGLSSDVRYDSHGGGDDGTVLNPRGLVRAGDEVGGGVRLGAELGAWFPGSESSQDTLDGLSPEARALLAWGNGSFVLASHAGYRVDRSESTSLDASRLSFGDRLAIGLSDFDAVLAGIGAAYRIGKTNALVELSADILVGDGAPPISESPLRASAGVRHPLGDMFQIELLADVSLSSRPSLDPGDPAVPIEPRVSILAGLRSRFDLAPGVVKIEPEPKVKDEPVAKPKKPEPVAPTTVNLNLKLTDENGNPVSGATVRLTVGEKELDATETGGGNYSFEGLQLGEATLDVDAEGSEPVQKKIVLGEKMPKGMKIELQPKLPSGQVRGLIRSIGGQSLTGATIRIEPGGIETQSDEEGFFQVDVSPGEYELEIRAPGYRTQSRKVLVEKDGVVVLNAELYKR